jgi:hypothetical protein
MGQKLSFTNASFTNDTATIQFLFTTSFILVTESVATRILGTQERPTVPGANTSTNGSVLRSR